MALKVPHVTIRADYGQESSVGELSTLSVGYGLHQAWIYATLFGTSSVFGISMGANGLSSSPVFMISIITYFCSLLALGAFDQKILKYLINKQTATIAALLMSGGTLLILFCGQDSPIMMPMAFGAGIATGIGSAILIEFWGTAFSRTGSASIILNTAIAIVVAIGTYGIILHLAPAPYSGITAALLPLVEVGFLRKHTPKSYIERRKVPIFNPLPVNRMRFCVLIGIPMLLFGYALGDMREQSITYMMLHMDMASQLPLLLAAGISTIAVITCGLGIMHDERADALMRPLLPLIAIAAFFIPLTIGQTNLAASIAVMVGYMSFEGLIWIVLGSFSQRYRISPVLIFGMGRGSLAMGAFIGANSTGSISAIANATGYGSTATILFILICLLSGFALMPREQDIRRAVTYGGKNEETTIDALNLAEDKEGSKSACRLCKEANNSAGASSNSPSEAGGLFRKKCERIANRYLLSSRETEVLFYLAKGHNAAYLQSKLFISEGTAKTHIRHIYGKTDVHNQQELMSLVESEWIE